LFLFKVSIVITRPRRIKKQVLHCVNVLQYPTTLQNTPKYRPFYRPLMWMSVRIWPNVNMQHSLKFSLSIFVLTFINELRTRLTLTHMCI